MTAAMVLLGLPDLDRLRELLKRIQEILALGGIALALAVSFLFMSNVALLSAYVPVGLTLVAGLGALIPALAPYVLKAFALAVVFAALSWCVAIATIIAGGNRQSLSRARRALLLAGTPWYCLAVWLSTFL